MITCPSIELTCPYYSVLGNCHLVDEGGDPAIDCDIFICYNDYEEDDKEEDD